MTIEKMLCEHDCNPLGLDTPRPRFTWQTTGPGDDQVAYRIIVEEVGDGSAIRPVWDSGTVDSASREAVYAGEELQSRGRYRWRLSLRSASGCDALSDNANSVEGVAVFEMGLLSESDWTSGWWSASGQWSGRALQFRLPFAVSRVPDRARAYICGIGYHVLTVNGRRLDDRVLEPAWTDYSRRVLYSTYDIGSALATGENVVGVLVGNGWYGKPILRAQIELSYPDGRRLIVTDGDWAWTVSPSPVVQHDVLDGETCDARLEQPGWDRPGFHADPTRWIAARADAGPGGRMQSMPVESIRVVDCLDPVSRSTVGESTLVLDFGENLAGWCRIEVSGPRGATVGLLYAETLADGRPDRRNLRSAAARQAYVLRGSPGAAMGSAAAADSAVEIYEPNFCYFGFRYVEVESPDPRVTLHSVIAQKVRTDAVIVGSFRSSNEILNRLWEMVVRTEAANIHGVPTDCPQRDERMAWLNDMRVRAEAALYAFDLYRLYRKWLDDIADAQDPGSGAIPDTAPYRWGARRGDPVNCPVSLVWQLYRFYGDRMILSRSYEMLRGWMRYLDSLAEEGIIRFTHYGDWCAPEEFCFTEDEDPGPDNHGAFLGVGSYAANTTGALVSTAYYHHDACIMERIAIVLGSPNDAAAFRDDAARIRRSFNQRFHRSDGRGYGTGSQGSNTLALALGLVPDDFRGEVVSALVADLEERGALTTGNQSTKYLLEVLAGEGHADLAYSLATRVDYPSWGYMMRHGATTLWERWEDRRGTGMNSHNHPMFGSIGAYLARWVAGLYPDDEEPGWRRFHFRPPAIAGLSEAEMSYSSPPGPIATKWTRRERSLELEVTVPPGSECVVHIDGSFGEVRSVSGLRGDGASSAKPAAYVGTSARIPLGPGRHSLSIRLETVEEAVI